MTSPYKAPNANLSNSEHRDIRYMLTSFSGRIGRIDFWLGFFIIFGAYVAVFVSYFHWFSNPIPLAVPAALLIYPLIALSAKRYHDHDRSGWLAMIWLAPLVGWMFALIECGFSKGSPMPNKYGPPRFGPLAKK